MDHRAFQQPVAHQIQQRLQVLAALDDPARQGLARDFYAVSAQHRFEAMQRQAVDILGGQQHRQHAGAGHALFNQLRGFVGGDRSGFATTATVNFTDVFDDPDLHRHDVQLLAGFFTDHMLAATAGAGQFVFGQFVDDFDTRQLSRLRFALAATRSRRNHFFVGVAGQRYRHALRLIEQGQLRCVGFYCLLGFTTEQTVAQQLDLFFQIDNLPLINRALNQ